jgi:two-component system, cell cycle sensor histidine kinase and response regulator CckA
VADQKQDVILVVEDDLADLELMCIALRKQGYRVLPASSYLAGVNTYNLHSGAIDLVVTAVSLPEKNGCEMAKKLLVGAPDQKVLFVSFPAGAEICRFYGMLGPRMYFLEKPLDPQTFVRRVSLVMESSVRYRTAGPASNLS